MKSCSVNSSTRGATSISCEPVLGFRDVETHQVVTYALPRKAGVTYRWSARGGYIVGPNIGSAVTVIWGFFRKGRVCCLITEGGLEDLVCLAVTVASGSSSHDSNKHSAVEA